MKGLLSLLGVSLRSHTESAAPILIPLGVSLQFHTDSALILIPQGVSLLSHTDSAAYHTEGSSFRLMHL